MRFISFALVVGLALPIQALADQSLPELGDVGAALNWAHLRALLTPDPESKPYNPWKAVLAPTKTPAESIGSYDAGCLRGGVALDLTGEGFQAMRPSRRRFFGHPRLVGFLRTLGKLASLQGLGPILVGDLGQPRGGPTLSGHASHQTGLDVDVWFLQAPKGKILSAEERETLSSPSVVADDLETLNSRWTPGMAAALKLAASDADVERIFVNAAIKKTLCKDHKGEGWLSKLRPWWGHADHFHARLKCSPLDAHCRGQEAVSSGDGCDASLDEWFSPETKAKARSVAPAAPPTMPKLPPLCQQVLAES